MRLTFLAATALIVSPAIAIAAPPAAGSISPHHETGQLVGEDGLECDEGGTAPRSRKTAFPARIMPESRMGPTTRTPRPSHNMTSPVSGGQTAQTARL